MPDNLDYFEDLSNTHQLFDERDLTEDPPFQFRNAFAANQPVGFDPRDLSQAIGHIISNVYETAATTDLALAVDKGFLSRNKYLELQLYLPGNIKPFQEALAFIVNIAGPDFVLGDILMLPARLEFGLRLANLLVVDPSDERISTDVFADAWKHVAGGTLEALTLVNHVQDQHGKKVCELSLPQELLNEVLSGKYPCLDRSGNVSIPNWAERRKSKRYRCNVDVGVTIEGRFQPGTIRNFSDRGLGITGLQEVEVNDTAVIERIEGSELTGRVVRVDGDWCGVLLDEALEFRDPLYDAASSSHVRS